MIEIDHNPKPLDKATLDVLCSALPNMEPVGQVERTFYQLCLQLIATLKSKQS